MYCSKCGKQISENVKFCEFCGNPIDKIVSNDKVDVDYDTGDKGDFAWAYQFIEDERANFEKLKSAIEKKGDYQLIRSSYDHKDLFVYRKGIGSKVGVIILYKMKDQVFIFGNENGLASVKIRYVNQIFRNVYKEKIYFEDLDYKKIEDVLTGFEVEQGRKTDGPVGVGGWLYFPLISFFIFTPIITLIIVYIIGLTFLSFLAIVLAAYGIYAGVLLVKIKPNAVKHTKILLIINFVIIIAMSSSGDSAGGMGRDIIVNLIWLCYFFISKRVKATYQS